jgi:hypothetical protein
LKADFPSNSCPERITIPDQKTFRSHIFSKLERDRLMFKVCSYNNQDIQKGRLYYNERFEQFNRPHLEVQEVIDLINENGLACYYCDTETRICPKKKYCGRQFTLDRINNYSNHQIANLKICCWSCNEIRSNKFTCEEFRRMRSRSHSE